MVTTLPLPNPVPLIETMALIGPLAGLRLIIDKVVKLASAVSIPSDALTIWVPLVLAGRSNSTSKQPVLSERMDIGLVLTSSSSKVSVINRLERNPFPVILTLSPTFAELRSRLMLASMVNSAVSVYLPSLASTSGVRFRQVGTWNEAVKLPSSSVVIDDGVVSTSSPSKVMVIDRSSLKPVPLTVTFLT